VARRMLLRDEMDHMAGLALFLYRPFRVGDRLQVQAPVVSNPGHRSRSGQGGGS
jgi:hypothetical protein